MRLLLYGGTFDPPHNGHLNNLRAAAARVRPDLSLIHISEPTRRS